MVEFQAISHLVEGDSSCQVYEVSEVRCPRPLKLLTPESSYLFCLFVKLVPF